MGSLNTTTLFGPKLQPTRSSPKWTQPGRNDATSRRLERNLASRRFPCADTQGRRYNACKEKATALGVAIGPDYMYKNTFEKEVYSDLYSERDLSHPKIKERIAELRGLPGSDHVFLGVGSDEVIDLLMCVCVTPGREKILITPPMYGMYAVCTQANDISIVKVNLELTAEGEGGEKGRFSLCVDDVKKTIDADPSIKLIFLCSS